MVMPLRAIPQKERLRHRFGSPGNNKSASPAVHIGSLIRPSGYRSVVAFQLSIAGRLAAAFGADAQRQRPAQASKTSQESVRYERNHPTVIHTRVAVVFGKREAIPAARLGNWRPS